jgi:serine protease inhibitor
MRFFHTAARLSPLAFFIACSGSPTTPGSQPAELQSLPRALSVGEQQVIDASNAFSFALFGRGTVRRDSNVFLSPLSASFSLGMTMNGAAGTTFDEMRSALQFGSMSQQEIDASYKSLIALLTSLDPAVTMQIANAIWYRQGFPFNQSFLDTTKAYFDAEVRGLNFADVAGSLGAINGWVNTKTNGKIPTILETIDQQDVMFLVNAIYFNGSWRSKFDAAETIDAPFTAFDGSKESLRLMHRNATMAYAETDAYQAVDLPYGNGAFSMTVVLPKAGRDVESVAASLTPAAWQSLTGRFNGSALVDLYLPKIKLSYQRQLASDLVALGMKAAFVPGGADFTRMSPAGKDLYIAFVKQKTFVDVHEEGTEAAAVTVTGIRVISAPITQTMRVDRPFLFVLRERLSGTILFMGKIVRPPAA